MAHDITLAGGAGEYMESATVVSWEAKLGDTVKAGDIVVVVETAKAATEIEAGADGVLVEILTPVGSEVGIGAVLGRVGDGLAAPASAPQPVAEAVPSAPAATPPPPAQPAAPRVSISPLARRIARQAGIDPFSLTGTGPGGRIKSRDVEAALRAHPGAIPAAAEAVAAPAALAPQPVASQAVPLVLVHGFGANAAAWNAVRPRLAGAQPILTPELPGHGRAAALAEPSLDALADSILSQIEATGARECDLVGHSLGGAVAALVAGNLSVRVRSLTLIAPAGLGPEIDGDFLSGFLAARTSDGLTAWLERLVADRASLPRSYAQAVLRERAQQPVEPAQAAIARRLFPDGAQAVSVADAIERFPGPLRVIWGREDRIVPARHQERLPGQAARHLLAGIGHMPHVEAPALVARLIQECVRSA